MAADEEATGWFEPLYGAVARGERDAPWDAREASPELVAWLDERAGAPPDGEAVVVGCGLGDDAAELAGRGWATTAFDVAPTAVRLARERHPASPASFVVADVLDLPAAWAGRFALVVEHFTVQAMHLPARERATAAVRSLVAPGGTLVVQASTTDDASDARPGPPWRMTAADLDAFARDGLQLAEERPTHREAEAFLVLRRA